MGLSGAFSSGFIVFNGSNIIRKHFKAPEMRQGTRSAPIRNFEKFG